MSITDSIHKEPKAPVVLGFSLISLALFLISAFVSTAVCQEWYGLAVAVFLMFTAIYCHFFGKRQAIGYILSFALNSVANGFAVSAYYIINKIDLDIYDMIAFAMPAAVILFLVYALLDIFNKSKTFSIAIGSIVNVLLAVLLFVLWMIYNESGLSFGFFCSLISLFYICVFGITVNNKKRSVLRDISFGSFGTVVIVIVVVLVALTLSDGDALDVSDIVEADDAEDADKAFLLTEVADDVLDESIDFTRSKKKKKNNDDSIT